MTRAQENALLFAASRPVDRPDVCPRRGQERMFHALMKAGLLRCTGMGCDEEDHERDVWLYVITSKGRAAIGGVK